MPSLLQPSLRQAELKDLLGFFLFFIFLEDGGKCGIGACELRPHPPRAIPLCWSCFRTAEKHIPSPLHHPLRHGDEKSNGRSRSSNNSPRDDQMVPLRTIARVAVAEEIYSGTSQHAKEDLKSLIVSVIPIYSFSDTINLFRFLFFI